MNNLSFLTSFIIGETEYYVRTFNKELALRERNKTLESSIQELNILWKGVEKSDQKLSNPDFIKNAKPEIVDIEIKKFEDTMNKIQMVENRMGMYLGI
jgi:valyl-tRNA synthetase